MELEGSGFVAMVDAGHIEDLARMYALFRRVPGGLDLLRHTMGDHIRSTGRALVQVPPQPPFPSLLFAHVLPWGPRLPFPLALCFPMAS